MITALAIDTRAAKAHGLARLVLPAGAVVVLEDGRSLRVQPSGALDPVVQGGTPHGGIGEDPTAARRRS